MHFHQEFPREAYVCELHPNWHCADSAALLFLRLFGSPQAPIMGDILQCPFTVQSTCTHTSTPAFFHLSEEAQFPYQLLSQMPPSHSSLQHTHKYKGTHLKTETHTVHLRGSHSKLRWANVKVTPFSLTKILFIRKNSRGSRGQEKVSF